MLPCIKPLIRPYLMLLFGKRVCMQFWSILEQFVQAMVYFAFGLIIVVQSILQLTVAVTRLLNRQFFLCSGQAIWLLAHWGSWLTFAVTWLWLIACLFNPFLLHQLIDCAGLFPLLVCNLCAWVWSSMAWGALIPKGDLHGFWKRKSFDLLERANLVFLLRILIVVCKHVCCNFLISNFSKSDWIGVSVVRVTPVLDFLLVVRLTNFCWLGWSQREWQEVQVVCPHCIWTLREFAWERFLWTFFHILFSWIYYSIVFLVAT